MSHQKCQYFGFSSTITLMKFKVMGLFFQNRVVVLASPFFRLEKHLPVLEEVVLEGCGAWLTPQDLTLLMSHCSALQVTQAYSFLERV